MTDLVESSYTPLEVPLPPGPDASFFTETQWKTLFALADTIIPSIRTAATVRSSTDKVISMAEWDSAVAKLSSLIPSTDAAKVAAIYLEEDVSSNPVFRACVERIMGHYVHEAGKNGFGLIMNALKYEFQMITVVALHADLKQHANGIIDSHRVHDSNPSTADCIPGKGLPRLGYVPTPSPPCGLSRSHGHCQEVMGHGESDREPGARISSRPRSRQADRRLPL